ncbi:hypothetical protein ACJX0J_029863, partial [Zea mays]
PVKEDDSEWLCIYIGILHGHNHHDSVIFIYFIFMFHKLHLKVGKNKIDIGAKITFTTGAKTVDAGLALKVE